MMWTAGPSHWTAREAPFTAPRRRSDVIETELDGEAVLFDPQSGHTYRFNQTALAVWRLCDARTTTREIAERQMQAYDVDFETALDHVEQLTALFSEYALLDLA